MNWDKFDKDLKDYDVKVGNYKPTKKELKKLIKQFKEASNLFGMYKSYKKEIDQAGISIMKRHGYLL